MASEMMAVPTTTSESSCQLARARIRKMRRAMRRGLERALGSSLSSGPDGEDSSVRFASTGLGLKEEVIIAIETLVAQLAPEVIRNSLEEFDEICAHHRVEEKLASIAEICAAAGMDFEDDGDDANELNLITAAALDGGATTATAAEGEQKVVLARRNRNEPAGEPDPSGTNSCKRRVVEPSREARMSRCAAKETEVLKLRDMLARAEAGRAADVEALERKRAEVSTVIQELQRICDDTSSAETAVEFEKIFKENRGAIGDTVRI